MIDWVERKEFASVQLKLDGEGEGLFTATFSSLAPIVDRQGDVTLASAIPIGREVVVSAWNHSSSSEGVQALPAGRGVIRGDFSHAYVDGEFFTDTTHGRDTYLTVKALGKLTEWSYTYRPTDFSTSRSDLDPYGPTARRLLKSVDIFEVSPVLVGAGVGTHTDVIKSSDDGLMVMDGDIRTPDEVQRLVRRLYSDDEINAIWRQHELAARMREISDAVRFI